MTFDNYRWEHTSMCNKWFYMRDWHWRYDRFRQTLAVVTHDRDQHSPTWGRWLVKFASVTPGLYKLSQEVSPTFHKKEDAMAWATTMVHLEGLS